MATLDHNLFEGTSIDLRQNAGRSHAAQIVFWTFIGVEVLTFLIYYLQHSLLQEAKAGGLITNNEVNTNDTLVLLVDLVGFVIYIIATIVFIRWFRRAYFNLHQLGLTHLTRSEGWAAGSWFIPIINLYLPYQIMRDIWVGMQKFLAGETENYTIKSAELIGFWWLLFIVGNIASNITTRLSWSATDIPSLITMTQSMLVTCVLNIIGLLLAILLIRKTADIELELRKTVREIEERQDIETYTAE